MPTCTSLLPFDPDLVSPSILEAVTTEIDEGDRFRTENWEGAKRIFDAAYLGGPPIFRRACRGVLKGRYERAALAIPGAILCVAALPTSVAAALTIGLLNKARHKPRSTEAVWEHRFCVAVEYHRANMWRYRTKQFVEREKVFKSWVADRVSEMPDRIRYSEKIWWRMRKWSQEISMCEKMSRV